MDPLRLNTTIELEYMGFWIRWIAQNIDGFVVLGLILTWWSVSEEIRGVIGDPVCSPFGHIGSVGYCKQFFS